jgi:hypothetical protein
MLVSSVSSSIPVRGVRPVGDSSRSKSNLGNKTPSGSKPKGDSIELSGTAIVRSLKLQGLSQNQIALQMGLDVKTVDGYLGIAPTISYSAVQGTLQLQA